MLDPALFSRQLTWTDAQRFADRQVVVWVPHSTGAAQVALDVLRVAESAGAPGTHQFVIVFRGPSDPLLAQATYQLRHPELGDFAVFMTPTSRKPDGYEYEACFTHVV